MQVPKLLPFVFAILSTTIQSSHQSPITPRDASSSSHHQHPYGSNPPMTTLAGVPLIDTPIVRAAHSLAKQHAGDGFIYNHLMRSWLFGALAISHSNNATNTTKTRPIDLEVHAVAALLHDLGWDRGADSPYVSGDKRFEVDGAIGARAFVEGQQHSGSKWDDRRAQLVWDAVALHTQASIFAYKEGEVVAVGRGIKADFASGPSLGVTDQEYARVVEAFPYGDFAGGVNETLVWLCASKPETTYDTFMQPWGEHYVPGYDIKGHTLFSTVNPSA